MQKGSSELHAQCIEEILLGTNQYAVLFKNPVGVGRCLATGNIVKYGLSKGSPDLIGWLKCTPPVFIGLEIKTGKAVLSPDQIRFEKICLQYQVPYLLVRYQPEFLLELCTRLDSLCKKFQRSL